jgi:hypothetical protein
MSIEADDPRREVVDRCKICPFPVGTRCESGVPCNYNKHHGGTLLRKKPPKEAPETSDCGC